MYLARLSFENNKRSKSDFLSSFWSKKFGFYSEEIEYHCIHYQGDRLLLSWG